MHGDLTTVALDTFGVLRARGADAVSFLQGQLSNDLTHLSEQSSLLAGYHNPQGRVIAVLRMLQLARDDLLAVLPRELIPSVAARLSRFILRAKVTLADDSPQWRIEGLLSTGRSAAPAAHGATTLAGAISAALPEGMNGVVRVGGASVLRLAREPARWLLLQPASAASPGVDVPADSLPWQRLAVAAGEPQVYLATSEEFIGQMLNLDCLGAIAFDKGCYTGQEVIARAHYRGRVKRRMQRFATIGPQQLAPGDAGTLADGRAFKVVDTVRLPDGRCEFLAVTQLSAAGEAEAIAAAPQRGAAPLEARQLELPYALPE